jgi:hypothetical protein
MILRLVIFFKNRVSISQSLKQPKLFWIDYSGYLYAGFKHIILSEHTFFILRGDPVLEI